MNIFMILLIIRSILFYQLGSFFLNYILDTVLDTVGILKDIVRCDIISTKKICELPCCVRAD